MICTYCGEDSPVTLEKHHVDGRNHDKDLLAVLCRNCHAKATEGQRCADVDLRSQTDPLRTEVQRLRSRSAFYRDQADADDKRADLLGELSDLFGIHFPGWAELWRMESKK